MRIPRNGKDNHDDDNNDDDFDDYFEFNSDETQENLYKLQAQLDASELRYTITTTRARHIRSTLITYTTAMVAPAAIFMLFIYSITPKDMVPITQDQVGTLKLIAGGGIIATSISTAYQRLTKRLPENPFEY